MATLDMTKFVRDDTLNLICCGCGVYQSAVKINRLAARDERVDRFVVDQDDIDI